MIRTLLARLFRRRPAAPEPPPAWDAALRLRPEVRGYYLASETIAELGLRSIRTLAAVIEDGDLPAGTPLSPGGPAVWIDLEIAAFKRRRTWGLLRGPRRLED